MTATNSTHPIDLESEAKRFHAFVNLALFMAAITGIELVFIFIPFTNFLVAAAIVGLSAAKFIGVILWFMHLLYDKFFCALFFLIGLLLAGATATALLLLFNSDSALPLESAALQNPVSRLLA